MTENMKATTAAPALSIPAISLTDGRAIPQVGLGVLRVKNDQTQQVVESALNLGYRHIDAAAGYGNEAEVGAALTAAGLAQGAKREQLWLTTKLKDSEQGYDSALRAFDRQLGLLGLDYVDLYMIHWPTPWDWRSDQTWRAFQKLRAEGRVRSLGVCNFLPEHLERLHAEMGEYPVINQIELHPTWQQRAVVDYCRERGIVVEAYSPLARGADLTAGAGLFERLAQAHSRPERPVSPAQIILRWQVENGTVIIPKSTHVARQRENADLFDFALTAEEHAQIDALDSSVRAGHDPLTFAYA